MSYCDNGRASSLLSTRSSSSDRKNMRLTCEPAGYGVDLGACRRNCTKVARDAIGYQWNAKKHLESLGRYRIVVQSGQGHRH